jgi:putative FmdB family regulatory protein
MPFYEYKCRGCGHKYSALIPISRREEEESRLVCPECGDGQHERLISLFSSPASVGAPGGGGSATCSEAASCPAAEGGG